MKLKAFTSYVCPIGAGERGHSSIYTGAYRSPRDGEGVCICGVEMVEEFRLQDGFRYRLEFETIDPVTAAAAEARGGKRCWPALSETEWQALPWHAVNREADYLHEINGQYKALSRWEATHEQPIRNVRILRSVASEWQPCPG